MSSKKFRGKTCVYCLAPNISSTRDHLFAESFFEEIDKPSEMPQVPACEDCNHKKSNLEKYLTATLPFGSRLNNSKNILSKTVPKRLKKNPKLHKELATKSTEKWARNPENGLYMIAVKDIPFDNQKFYEWLKYLTQGLSWYYFKINLLTSNQIKTELLEAKDDRCLYFDEILKRFASVRENLSEAFIFSGAKVNDMIIWEVVLLGGLKFDQAGSKPDRIFLVMKLN